MTEKQPQAAAIAGSLVGLKQVGTHKSVVLSIHVPEELATQVIAAFGWPTGANPVDVVVFRPAEGLQATLTASLAQEQRKAVEAPPAPPTGGIGALKPSMPTVNYIGMLCQDASFQRFMACPSFGDPGPLGKRKRGEWTADAVRQWVGVVSRRHIPTSASAMEDWRALHNRYEVWLTQQEASQEAIRAANDRRRERV